MHENQRVRAVNRVQKVEKHFLQRSTELRDQNITNNVFEVPELAGDFVGLWAVPSKDANLKYPMFGPIFEAEGRDPKLDLQDPS
jgi:hypothetical protein